MRTGHFDFFRHRGDDAFFPHTVLKNGWVVLEVNGGVEDSYYAGGSEGTGSYVAGSRVGTVKGLAGTTWYIAKACREQPRQVHSAG